MKRIWVLILNYQTYQRTIAYVANLKHQKDVQLSILIVDNNSPNDSFTKLSNYFSEDKQVVVLQSGHNGGYAFGNNVGLHWLKQHQANYVLVSNNDIVINNPLLVAELMEIYESLPNPGFIAPAMYVNGEMDQKHQAWKIPTVLDDAIFSLRTAYWLAHSFGRTNRYTVTPALKTRFPVECLTGSFFLSRVSIFEEVGYFDPNTFLYCEETILGYKLKLLQKQNYLIPHLNFHHDTGRTTKTFNSAFRLKRYWLNSTLYFHKTYRNTSGWQVLLLYVAFILWIPEQIFFVFFKKWTGLILVKKPVHLKP